MALKVELSAATRSNLLSLQTTASLINRTNGRLNTGLKVSSVIDDAVAFFQARSLSDRAEDFTAKKADIDQGISSIKTALEATSGVDSLLKQLKGVVLSAKSATSTERGALQLQYTELKRQIDQLAQDSSYQGLNLVNNSTSRLGISFSNLSASRIDVTAQRLTTATASAGASVSNYINFVSSTNSINYFLNSGSVGTAVFSTGTITQISGLVIFEASQFNIQFSTTSTLTTHGTWSHTDFTLGTGSYADYFNSVLDVYVSSIDSAISSVRGTAKTLGTNVAVLQTRLDFTTNYTNLQTEGAGKFTLADLNEEGANLVALQTRQQLGTQALAFAGQSEQSVLTLFR